MLLAGTSALVPVPLVYGQTVISVPNLNATNISSNSSSIFRGTQTPGVDNRVGNTTNNSANSDSQNSVSAVPVEPVRQAQPSAEERLAQDLSNNRRPAQRDNNAAPVVEAGVRPVVEEDPFAPSGINLGSLRLTTFIKQSVGYSSNQESTANGTAGALTRTELDLNIVSQWQRHELTLRANGQYEQFFDDTIEPKPQITVEGGLRLDLVDGFTLRLGGNYNFAQEAATSPSLTQSAIDQPGVHSFGTFAELQRAGGNIDMTLRASINRTQYEDGTLSSGQTFSQEDRNVNTFGLSTRLGYQNGLAYSPFVQFDYANNVHDLRADRNGELRDSQIFELRGGIAVNISEKVSGEFSVGFAHQEFEDNGLTALAGMAADANLNWSPYRDTNIAFIFGSDLGGSTTLGDSGAISYNGEIAATRRIRDNLEVNARIGVSYTNFEGLNRIDTAYTFETGFEYWLNRTFSITGDARYEILDSSITSNSYDETVFTLGIKAQR